MEAKSTTGARLAAGTKRGVEGDINVLSVENASVRGEYDSNGGTGSINYLGKNGSAIISSGIAVSKGAGGSFEQETIKKGNQVVSQTKEAAAGHTIFGVGNISGSYESTKTGNSTTQTVRGFVGIGAVLGLSQTFDVEIRIGIKAIRKVGE